jgi:hypothetical protein
MEKSNVNNVIQFLSAFKKRILSLQHEKEKSNKNLKATNFFLSTVASLEISSRRIKLPYKIRI